MTPPVAFGADSPPSLPAAGRGIKAFAEFVHRRSLPPTRASGPGLRTTGGPVGGPKPTGVAVAAGGGSDVRKTEGGKNNSQPGSDAGLNVGATKPWSKPPPARRVPSPVAGQFDDAPSAKVVSVSGGLKPPTKQFNAFRIPSAAPSGVGVGASGVGSTATPSSPLSPMYRPQQGDKESLARQRVLTLTVTPVSASTATSSFNTGRPPTSGLRSPSRGAGSSDTGGGVRTGYSFDPENSKRKAAGYQRRTQGVAPPGLEGQQGVGGGAMGSNQPGGRSPWAAAAGGRQQGQQQGVGGGAGRPRSAGQYSRSSPGTPRSYGNRDGGASQQQDGSQSSQQGGYRKRPGSMRPRDGNSSGGNDMGREPSAYDRRQLFLARAEEMAKLTAAERETVDFINEVELKGGMDVVYTAYEGFGNPNKSKMSVNYGIIRQRKAREARLKESGVPDVSLDAGSKALNALGVSQEDADDVNGMFNMIRVHNRSYKNDEAAGKIALKIKELEKLYADDIFYSEAMGEDEYQQR